MDFVFWLLSYVVPFLAVLTIIVFVHEMGHFIEAKRERLNHILALAKEWNRLSCLPAAEWVNYTSRGRKSLFELMSSDELDIRAIHSVMKAVAVRVRAAEEECKSRSLAERLRRKGFTPPPENLHPRGLVRHRQFVCLPDDDE